MRKSIKLVLGIMVVVSLVMATSTGPKVDNEFTGGSAFIEVCGRGIVYIPPGTEYVTCRGRVMKVLGIVPLREGGTQTEGGGSECFCPNCCGGACAVIVSCGQEPEVEATRSEVVFEPRSTSSAGLCTMYLYCGD